MKNNIKELLLSSVLEEHNRLMSSASQDFKSESFSAHIHCQDGVINYSKILFYFFEPTLGDLLSRDVIEVIYPNVLVDELKHQLNNFFYFVPGDLELSQTSPEDNPAPEPDEEISQDASAFPIQANNNDDSEGNVEKVVCEKCGSEYRTKMQLQKHQYYAHSPKAESMPFKCSDCEKTFKWRYELKQHKVKHESPSIFCEFCDSKFKCKKGLIAHYNSKHSETKLSYQCDKCDKSFNVLSNFKRHQKVHQEPLHLCKYCDMTFNRVDKFKNHMLKKHKSKV